MHRNSLSLLRPNVIELWYIFFISCVLLLVGNGKLLLQKAGLITSAQLIGQQVSTKVLWGTNWFDNFKFTAGVINLIVWGTVGLIIYTTLQSIVRSLRIFAYKRDFDSGLYVHPQGYTHQAYWRQIILSSVFGFVLLAVFAVCAIAYVFIALPDSFVHVEHFIVSPSFGGLIDPFVAISITCVTTGVMYILLKLVIQYHRISDADL